MDQQPQLTITVTTKDVETILGALSKQPFELVADLFMNIRSQAVSQLQPPAPMTDPDVEPVAPVQ